MKSRLSLMMFLEYFIWGAWYVTVGTWLGQGMHFSGEQIGLAAGTTAIGAIASPFFIGLIADKLFATQKVLAVLHALGAVLLFLASSQTTFGPIYLLVLLYAVAYMPTLALTNSLAFRQMSDPKLEFAPIRVLGTGGWITAGILVGSLRLEATAMPLRLAAGASLAMAIYCLTLPNTPPLGATKKFGMRDIFPSEVLNLFRERSFAIFALASFLICIPLQFYYAFTNLFLNEIGVKNAASKMTGGQMSELFCMLLIPWFFRRLGVKYMLVAGMSAWTLRYALFAYGNPGAGVWMLWLGILLHGICYDFFFVTGQIYIDRKSSPAFRAAAQGTITLITYGLGMLLGSWLSGRVVDFYVRTGADGLVTHAWRPIWLFSAGCSAVVLLLFFLTFSGKEADASMRGVPTEEMAEGVPL
ncbi:Nucleoside permease NupG [Acidisarcina polymorpha]|uniref:Nucleoside permease NupG n=1 Tax=Acidisarcina polymorpha TaxID=2211140 RepID=A0A2Z5G2X5_9BACT|nr:nucleoside permease [Acidisarcina polymorpha]AXC13409.1 Nucleoside permease NupG [Acidisarcina polymorpha]